MNLPMENEEHDCWLNLLWKLSEAAHKTGSALAEETYREAHELVYKAWELLQDDPDDPR